MRTSQYMQSCNLKVILFISKGILSHIEITSYTPIMFIMLHENHGELSQELNQAFIVMNNQLHIDTFPNIKLSNNHKGIHSIQVSLLMYFTSLKAKFINLQSYLHLSRISRFKQVHHKSYKIHEFVEYITNNMSIKLVFSRNLDLDTNIMKLEYHGEKG